MYLQVSNSLCRKILDFCVFFSEGVDNPGLEIEAGKAKLIVDEDISLSAGTGNTLAITDRSCSHEKRC